jgi:4'-phosphopantetheinyl transferase
MTSPVAAAGAVAGPRPRVCAVWWARVADVRPEHHGLLAPSDRLRLSRLPVSGARRRSTAAAAVARLVLGSHLGVAAADLEIDRTCSRCGAAHGKPRLRDRPEVHFSVSRSGGWVCVAVLPGSPVGVDVEQISRMDGAELHRLSADVLTADERADLYLRPLADQARAFTTYWCRKEAVLKATGDGLTVPLHRLEVSPPSSPPRVVRWDGRVGEPVSLHHLHSPVGYAAALAVVGPDPEQVVERDAGPLLGGVR